MNYFIYLKNIFLNPLNNYSCLGLLAILIVATVCVFRILKKKKSKKLKKPNYKMVPKGFFSTGINFSFSIYDVVKFKIRFNDYCDKKGVNYISYFSFKLFNFERCSTKYMTQSGRVIRRRIKFGGIK